MDPGTSLCRLAKHLLHAHVARHRGVFQDYAGEFIFHRKGQTRKGTGRRFSDHRDRRKTENCHIFSERSEAHAANLGKS